MDRPPGLIDLLVLGYTTQATELTGTINISSANDTIGLDVSDSADTTGQIITIGAATLSFAMPNTATINYAHLEGLEIDGGSGANTFKVNNTPNGPDPSNVIYTIINTGNGNDTTNVSAVAPASQLTINDGLGQNTVNLGDQGTVGMNDGSVAMIEGDVYVNSPPNTTTLKIDDSNDTNGYTAAALDTGKLTGVAPGTITWDALNALFVFGGSGGNQWTIDGGAANGVTGTTTLNAGSGNNTVDVDSDNRRLHVQL